MQAIILNCTIMRPEQTLGLPSKAIQNQLVVTPAIAPIRKLVWIYFILLMIEGALRKWLLKGLSEPLLIIRDPIVINLFSGLQLHYFQIIVGFGSL